MLASKYSMQVSFQSSEFNGQYRTRDRALDNGLRGSVDKALY